MNTKPTYTELEQRVKELERQVSACREMDEALAESEARYKGIVENTINGVVVYQVLKNGEEFIVIDFNKGAEKIEKISREDVVGKSVTEVFPGVREFGLLEVFKRVWKTGAAEHFPLSVYKDERIAGWRDNFVYKLPSGEIVAVYTDETERKRSEDALREAHEQLRRFSQELENIVYQKTRELEDKSRELIEVERLANLGEIANRVAHELRNPLTVVGGFVRRVDEKTPAWDPKKKYLRIVLSELTVLENKLSEIIKIEDER